MSDETAEQTIAMARDSDTTFQAATGGVLIRSETVATSPPGDKRARKKIGVGEEVNLSISPASWGPAKWTIDPPDQGALKYTSGITGTTNVYTAPERKVNPVRIIATRADQATCRITFEVIEPRDVIMIPNPDKATLHTKGVPSVGIALRPFILPDDVSFMSIGVSEGVCAGKGTGYFEKMDGASHTSEFGAGTWVKVMDNVVAGMGSEVIGDDYPQMKDASKAGGTPYRYGKFTWPIPYLFRVGESDKGKQFQVVDQTFEIDASGEMTLTKGFGPGKKPVTVKKALNDE